MSESRLSASAIALIVFVSVGLSAAAALAITLTLGPSGEDPTSDVATGRLARLEKENQKLETTVESLRKRLDAAEARDDAIPAAASAPDQATLDRAVEAWFAKHGTAALRALMTEHLSKVAPVAARGEEVEATAEKGAKEEKYVQQVFAQLEGKNLWTPEAQKLLREVAEAGKLDELLEVFRKHAKDNPQNATAQAALGSMLLQACDHTPSDSAKGEYAMAADKAFDQALKLDPEHWEARFTKALAYTFWPAFTGKPAEAVTQFEQLITQQERRRPEPFHAQTYLYLGNLHEQRGNRAKAVQVWRKGLQLFPNDAELRKKLP